jgi:tRNA/rRNA methyltransferase
VARPRRRALYNHFLLTESQSGRIDVVLVQPRNPLNIGAAARAMANFGLAHLSVVAPYEPHWREAKSAVQAEDLLQNARRTECLAEAVAGCTLVIGTGTVDRRQPEQPVVLLPELAPLVRRELDRGGRAALVFGPEKRGLKREELSHCHVLLEIPTAPRQPSMNLGQAVAVCLYELATRLAAGGTDECAPPAPPAAGKDQARPATEAAEPARPELPAPAGLLERLGEVIEETMTEARYSPAAMRAANRHDLRLFLLRLRPQERDARRMLGLFRRILWRLRH